MSPNFNPPLAPGLGANGGGIAGQSTGQTKNPFFTIANQFLPRNLHDVIRWVRFITLHSPLTTEVLRKLATYPVTSFLYGTSAPSELDFYKKIEKSFRLKNALHDVGFQYFTMGNVFVSVYYPFTRVYECPSCKAVYRSEAANFLTFKNFSMHGTCPKCESKVQFTRREVKLKSVKDMNLIIWDPVNIEVNHNPISGKSKYYYKVPAEIRRKILAGDKLTLDSTPWEFIECVKDKKDFEFADDSIYHMRNIDLGMSINGVAIPPIISHFNLVFYQTTLRRANESIATDFMSPMRILYPQAQTANSDPVVAISMRNFVSKMEDAMIKHKRDSNHVLISPVPVGYQAVSGEGKTLLVNQEIAQAEESLLLSMGVSRELLSGQTNWTSSTVGLRLLANTLDSYVGQLEELLEWIFSKTAAYLDGPQIPVTLQPFQLTDDDALKSILLNLASTGNVSMTTVYEAMGRDYKEELERIKSDAKIKAQHDVRVKFEVEQAEYLEGLSIHKINTEDNTFQEALGQCQQIAAQLIPADPATTRDVMNALKTKNYAHYLLVSKLVEEGRTDMTRVANADAALGATGDPNAQQGAPGTLAGNQSAPTQPPQA